MKRNGLTGERGYEARTSFFDYHIMTELITKQYMAVARTKERVACSSNGA